jgi:Terminase small subunit
MTDEPKPPKARRQCNGKNKRGQPCGRAPIRGGFVCGAHGGNAPQVQRKAKERLADLIDPNRTLREAARLAFSDLRKLFNENGTLKPPHEWPDAAAAAVAGLEVVRRNVEGGDGHTDDVIKVKLWDKSKNIELLAKHLGLLVEKLDVTVHTKVEDRLRAARQRLASAKNG